jgi:hypothetical protein
MNVVEILTAFCAEYSQKAMDRSGESGWVHSKRFLVDLRHIFVPVLVCVLILLKKSHEGITTASACVIKCSLLIRFATF